MKTLYSILFLFSFSTYLRAQALIIDSTRFITGYECCTDIRYAIPTADNGILFVGEDQGNPGGIISYFPLDTSANGNVLIGKIDSNHQISWIKVYGGSQLDMAFSVCETPDGGYAVLAETESSDGDVTGYLGGGDIWLLRIDDSGNLLWEKCYGSSENDNPLSVANTPDNGFIMLGATNGSDDNVPFHYGSIWDMDWVVIKTDSLGNVQWSKDLGGTGNEQLYGSIIAIDSSYYLISSTSSTDHDCTDSAWHSGVNTQDDYYILKLDDTGKVIWDSSYGGSEDDEINYAFFDTRDSTIVIAGSTFSYDYMVSGYHGNEDMWVVKVNKNGTLIWQKTLGSTQQENGTGICSANSGGYIAYCTTFPGTEPDTTIGDIGQQDCWLFNIDNSGNEITNKIFGGIGVDQSASIIPCSNCYVATGYSGSTIFTEGTTSGRYCDYENAFVSYIDYDPLAVNKINRQQQQLVTYPNPSQDKIRVIIPNNENGNLKIINCIGQVVYETEIQPQNGYYEINIEAWTNGIYCIIWQGEDGTVLTNKLIKN